MRQAPGGRGGSGRTRDRSNGNAANYSFSRVISELHNAIRFNLHSEAWISETIQEATFAQFEKGSPIERQLGKVRVVGHGSIP